MSGKFSVSWKYIERNKERAGRERGKRGESDEREEREKEKEGELEKKKSEKF